MSSLFYIPISSLNNEDISSLVNLCLSEDVKRVDTHGGRKVAIKSILNLHSLGFDLSSYLDLEKIKDLETKLNHFKKFDYYKKEFYSNKDDKFQPYWELLCDSPRIHQIAKSNRIFTTKRNPFSPEQLKVYFNTKQIENIPHSTANFHESGFVDDDAKINILQYVIDQRNNQGIINTKQARVEQAVFDIPQGKQIIILDFADERMPGGYFLEGATTQEETICYNSDTYRALLDLKYNRFDGGFFIPEFGCLYIKNVQFFKPPSYNEHRYVDIIAAACYDLTGVHGLHKRPDSDENVEENTRKKLKSVIAAAQANSKGNGEDTYLILGPIGCGAFKNNLHTIARLWAELLTEPLNDKLNTQQRHAFQHIWFLSGTDNKLKVFEQYLHLDSDQRL